VLIAGISAALAYGRWFQPGAGWRAGLVGLGRVWRRVWTIYLVQIVVTVAVLGAITALALWFQNPSMRSHNQMPAFLVDPGGAMMRIPLLIQQLDYVDILPMYLVLLLGTPLLLVLALRWPWVLLSTAVLLWWVTNALQLNLPNHPGDWGWYFNPLAWQLVFVIGLVCGAAMLDGRRLVPRHLYLQVVAWGMLAFALAWQQWPPLRDHMYGLLWQAKEAGWPDWLIGLEKTYLPLPRLLHVLVLAYALGSLDIVRRVCAWGMAAPLRLLGRQGLLVFATGSVISVALQTVRLETGQTALLDSVMIGGGLAVLFALAAIKTWWPGTR